MQKVQVVSLCEDVKMEKVLSELTSQSAVGKEERRMTSLKDKVMKEKCKEYEHRIYEEMNPETAEQLQQNENEVSRLRDR